MKKKKKNFSCKFFSILGHQNLWIRTGIQPKMLDLDPDPYQMKTDPQNCQKPRLKRLLKNSIPVLDLQAEGADAQDDETLEEGLAEAAQGRLLAHDDRAELAVVPHQDQLFGAQHRRHHAFRLSSLHALVLGKKTE